MGISKAKIAKELEINLKTFYNWEKNKPKLFNFIVNCYKNNSNNETITNITKEEWELLEDFRKLDEEEKKLYIYEIKARALRKKLK